MVLLTLRRQGRPNDAAYDWEIVIAPICPVKRQTFQRERKRSAVD
jgi:hypothetical protein